MWKGTARARDALANYHACLIGNMMANSREGYVINAVSQMVRDHLHLEAPVIGLAFDGTGFGTDGAIWGGEVLVTSLATFSRVAHLAYVPMPGSDAAVKEPWRMAVSYLNDAFGEGLWDLDLPILKDIDRQKLELVVQMISKKINSPFTSS
ncbi:MAG: hypothetical protein P8Y02_05775, partial [Deinococcales bacterium]